MTKPIAAPPFPTRNTGRPKVGTWDHLEVFLGARGSGKSTKAMDRCYEMVQEAGGAYVIGHSIGQRVPRALPDGTKLPIRYYRSIDELRKGLARWPNDWHFVAPPLPDEDRRPDLARSTADDVIRFGVSLSRSLRERAWLDGPRTGVDRWRLRVPAKGADFDGLECPPVIVVLDEGVAVQGAAGGDRAKGAGTDWFNEILISLRHLHMGVLFSSQGATYRSWRMLEQATAIYCFKIFHQISLNALRQAGATDDELFLIEHLPKYESIVLSPVVTDDEDRPYGMADEDEDGRLRLNLPRGTVDKAKANAEHETETMPLAVSRPAD